MTDTTLDLQKIAKAYDSPAWFYDIRGFFILTFTYRSTVWEQVGLFGKNMGPVHLEGAIGTGTLFNIILRWRQICRKPSVSITGFDYAEPMLNGARRRFKNWKNIKLLNADVGDLPFMDNYYDTINVANAAHCFPKISKALDELYRVLKPRGTMAINILLYPKRDSFLDRLSNRINNWGMKKGILYTPYTQDQATALIQSAGFRINFSERSGNVLNMIVQK